MFRGMTASLNKPKWAYISMQTECGEHDDHKIVLMILLFLRVQEVQGLSIPKLAPNLYYNYNNPNPMCSTSMAGYLGFVCLCFKTKGSERASNTSAPLIVAMFLLSLPTQSPTTSALKATKLYFVVYLNEKEEPSRDPINHSP